MVHELLVQQENKGRIICCGTDDDLFFKCSSSKKFLNKRYMQVDITPVGKKSILSLIILNGGC